MLTYGFVSFLCVFVPCMVFVIGLMWSEERAERKRTL